MGHHSKNVGVAVLLQDFTRSFARIGRIAIIDAGHGSPSVFRFCCALPDRMAVPFETIWQARSKQQLVTPCKSAAHSNARKVLLAISSAKTLANPATPESKCRRIAGRLSHG